MEKKFANTSHRSYAKFRRFLWRQQGGAKPFDFRASKMADGSDLTNPTLQPKKNVFLKDIIHCPSLHSAKSVVRKLCGFNDVTYIELKGTWVWIDYHSKHEGTHMLYGQEIDNREIYKGS